MLQKYHVNACICKYMYILIMSYCILSDISIHKNKKKLANTSNCYSKDPLISHKQTTC